MKKGALLIATLVLAVSGRTQDNKRTSRDVVDAGSFGIFLNGKRIGTEKFHIEQQIDLSIITAEVNLDDGTSKAEQSSVMQVAPNGDLRLYKWRATVPAREQSEVEPKDHLLIEHLTAADQKKRDIHYSLPLSTLILDDNFFSHREVLIWRYLATGCLRKDGQLACRPSQIGVLVPRQHMAGSITVELVGQDKITFKGAEEELNKIKLDADGVQWLVWVDDHYLVIKMAIPAGNVEVWRD